MTTEKNRVLLVDDDQVLRELLADLLSGNGYEVEEAANGLEALERVESRHYDHVITDLNMPEMDGLSFLKEVGKKGINLNITVLSAHSDMNTVVEAMKLGASDFIAKPFQSEDEILLTLQKVEERDRLERENVRLRKEVEDKYTFSNIV
ncbi:MAG: response regulator, partial [Desulfobulbaceae bacterium]|nr:response regulator [Desulfobulbaceae bacterium]